MQDIWPVQITGELYNIHVKKRCIKNLRIAKSAYTHEISIGSRNIIPRY